MVVPIEHEPTLAKIHLNFRLTYLTDVVMARYIDDISFRFRVEGLD